MIKLHSSPISFASSDNKDELESCIKTHLPNTEPYIISSPTGNFSQLLIPADLKILSDAGVGK